MNELPNPQATEVYANDLHQVESPETLSGVSTESAFALAIANIEAQALVQNNRLIRHDEASGS